MKAHAKINLALVVGPWRADGKHEVATVLQRVDLADEIDLEPAIALRVEGFADDTLVHRALQLLADAAGVEPRWSARIEKRIPIAAGLGGGSSDAATALLLANELVDEPLTSDTMLKLAHSLGSDVPFFLNPGAQLATGDGTILEPVDLPRDYTVLLLLPDGVVKESTAAVYALFEREDGFEQRREALADALARRDLAGLPPNDLASSPLAGELRTLGALRADVSGAGPTVYGLFRDPEQAEQAAAALGHLGRTWIVAPAW